MYNLWKIAIFSNYVHTLKVLNLNLQIGLPTRNLARGPWILSGATRPKPHFRWPDPALYNALLTEKLVKNGSKYVNISGPNPTRAQYGQPEPDPSQKKSGPTQPYLLYHEIHYFEVRYIKV